MSFCSYLYTFNISFRTDKITDAIGVGKSTSLCAFMCLRRTNQKGVFGSLQYFGFFEMFPYFLFSSIRSLLRELLQEHPYESFLK